MPASLLTSVFACPPAYPPVLGCLLASSFPPARPPARPPACVRACLLASLLPGGSRDAPVCLGSHSCRGIAGAGRVRNCASAGEIFRLGAHPRKPAPCSRSGVGGNILSALLAPRVVTRAEARECRLAGQPLPHPVTSENQRQTSESAQRPNLRRPDLV